jgi:hypothetical protein
MYRVNGRFFFILTPPVKRRCERIIDSEQLKLGVNISQKQALACQRLFAAKPVHSKGYA